MIFEKTGYNQITTLALEKNMDAKQIADHSGTSPTVVDLITRMNDPKLPVSEKIKALEPLAFQVLARKLIEEHDIHAGAYVLAANKG